MNNNQLYINGQWVDSISKDKIEVENPATEEIFEHVPAANEDDVNSAVEAAKSAFENWSKLSLDEKLGYLNKAFEIFEGYQDDLVEIEIKELGSPRSWAKNAHVKGPIKRFENYLKIAKDFSFKDDLPKATVLKEPIGVIGCLTPWNYPLNQVIQKVIPALICGNTVVLKPSQITPLSAYFLAEAFHKAELPPGVFNLVTGRGAEVGNVLASHKNVDMISFTGSTSGGIEVGKLALEKVKKLALELGGKSPNLVLRGSNYEEAVKTSLNSTFNNTGQTCSALTRLIVPKEDLEKIEEIIIKEAEYFKVGDPWEEETKVGPLSNKKQFEKVKYFVEKGIEEGAKLLVGEVPQKKDKGYFANPVVFSNVSNKMEIAQEEIFGPVLCVIPYEGIEEGIEIANDTIYGLSGAVFGPQEEAEDAAKRIKTGEIKINNGKWDPLAPFGGYKQSGIGREGGFYGLEEFVEIKTLFNK